MTTKNTGILTGSLFVALALITVFSNGIIGEYGFLRTDFTHNMIHFLSGIAIIFLALQYEHLLYKAFRAFGIGYLALAVLGAISIGFADHGRILGLVGASGADNILHLIIGVALVVLGTKEIRMPKDDVEEDAPTYE